MPWIPIAVAAISVIGGVVGNMAAQKDRDAADEAFNAAMAEIKAVGAPPDLSKQIILNKFKQAGILTPELEEAVSVAHSKVAQIQEDPNIKKAQVDALKTMQQRGQGGLNPEDRAAFNQLRDETQRDQEAKLAQIRSNMAARGLGGGGSELAMQLQAASAGANQSSAGGDRIAAQASMNALQAMQAGGQLASQVRGQDFNINNARASAEDELNRFNTQNQINRQQRNVSAKNQAQKFNLDERQRIEDENTNQANDELRRRNDAKRTEYLDKSGQARNVADMEMRSSDRFRDRAGRTVQQANDIASGVSKAVGGFAGGGASSAASSGSSKIFSADGTLPEDDSYLGTKKLKVWDGN